MGIHITTHVDLPTERLPGGIPIDPNKKGDREIVYFYSNYRRWILDYAETLINGKGIKKFEDSEMVGNTPKFVNDAGFAFLAVVNGYFDMIGQLCGSDGDQYDCYRQRNSGKFQKVAIHGKYNWSKWDKPPDKKDYKPQTDRCVWYGLTFVFSSDLDARKWNPKTNIVWARFCDSFYRYTRNPIAHTTFPSKLFITRDPIPIWDFQKLNNRRVLAINLCLWYEKISGHFYEYTRRIRFPKTKEDKELRRRFLKRYKKLRK